MDKNIILVCALLIFSLSFVSCLHQPFAKGNLLALKKNVLPFREGSACTTGGLVEFTPDGQIVQEVLFPSTATEENQACLLFVDDYHSRMTVSTDGYRAVIPCCNINQDYSSQDTSVSFAIVHGDGRFEITPILSNSQNHQPINAVMDGDDIWYTFGEPTATLMQLSTTETTATQIFQGSIFALQIHDGNLYVSNFDQSPCSLLRFDGLPKDPTDPIANLLPRQDVNSFVFIGSDHVALSLYVDGFQIYNLTSEELVLNSGDTSEIVQFVPLFEQNKVIAHLRGFDNNLPAIYSYPWNSTAGVTTFDSATLLLNSTEDGFFYYSTTLVPINSCADGVKNNDETDVDCGGSFCSQRCDGGKQCLTDGDCLTSGCTNNICNLPPTSAPVADPAAQPITSSPTSEISPVTTSLSNNPQANNLKSSAALLGASSVLSFCLLLLA